MPRRAAGDRKRIERVLDAPVGGRIDRLRRSAAGRVSICVEGRSVCTLSKDAVDRLGIRAGARWTPELASRLARALEDDIARQAAGRLLAYRQRGKGEMLDRLRRRGVRERTAESVVAELERRGGVDDARFAEAMARSMIRSKPAGARLIRARLRALHVDPKTADVAASRALAGRDPLGDALDLARRRLRSLPGSLDARTKARRLLGLLARRGFEADMARDVVREVVGDGGE